MNNNIFEPSVENIKKLNAQEAVNLFHDLLLAEASILGIEPLSVNVPSAITVADGGIDASVDTSLIDNPQSKGLIFTGKTRYQIKTGDFSSTPSNIKKLIIKPASIRKKNLSPNDIHDRVHKCLDNKGTFVVILFGIDKPEITEDKIESTIKELLTKISSNYKNAKIKVWMPNQLAKLIANYFPSLGLRLKGISPPHLIHSLEYMENCCALDGLNNYLQTESSKKIIEQIQSTLNNNNGLTHIRIIGEPGIGKTRLVYESIKKTRLSPITLYSEKVTELFKNGVIDQLYALSKNSPLILFFDECGATNRSDLQRHFNNITTSLTLITIHNESDVQDEHNPYHLINPSPLSNQEISQILREDYVIPNDHADHIAPYCSGSPRVAHAIGQHLKLHPKSTSILQLDGLDDLWNKYIAGHANINSEEYRLQHLVLQFIALFKKFGWKDPVDSEARLIHGLITQDAEPNLRWDKFRSIIKQLQSRRVLQGDTTLYITPKLLHIKLWKDWWENHYNSQYNTHEFLTQLSPSLQIWFGEMFEYANESDATKDIIKKLLGTSGPFHNLDGYCEYGNFFLILTKVDPKSAIQAIECALKNKTCEDLKQFINGRIQLVGALEHIALFGNYFERAIESLYLLAEAENESWSNNATGVFIDSFSLAPGKGAPTDLSPLERLSILKNYLNSSDEIRRTLALKAFNKAFSFHFVHMDIRQNFGLNTTIPQGWKPKTYGAIYDAYEKYLTALWNARQNILKNQDKSETTKIILNNIPYLIQIPALNEKVLEILHTLSQEGTDIQLAVIEKIVDILHYDKDALNKQTIDNLNNLYSALTEKSFSSKLRRYVSLNLLEDRYDKSGNSNNLLDQKFEELAKQAYQQPNLLNPELKWLVTDKAQNGFDFGKALSVLDLDITLWDSIYSTWSKIINPNNNFICGYLAGIFEKNKNKWEDLICTVTKGKNIIQLPYVVLRSGMTPKIAELLLAQSEQGSFDLSIFRIFIYGAAIKNIPYNILIKIIQLLIERETQDGLYTALDITHSIIYNKISINNDFIDLCDKILNHSVFFTESEREIQDTMTPYYWKEVALYSTQNNKDTSIPLMKKCLENLGKKGTIVGGYEPQSLEFLNLTTKNNPSETWILISGFIDPPLNKQGLSIMEWLSGGYFKENSDNIIFNLLPENKIMEWINQNPKTRAACIARFCSIETSDCTLTPLSRKLMEAYEDNNEVLEALHANYCTETCSGPVSDHYTTKLQNLLALKETEKNNKVRQWLENEIENLQELIKSAEIREERNEF